MSLQKASYMYTGIDSSKLRFIVPYGTWWNMRAVWSERKREGVSETKTQRGPKQRVLDTTAKLSLHL